MEDSFIKNKVYELLLEIRHRPEIYIGKRSLTELVSFMDGFQYAFYVINDKQKYINFFSGFRRWVSKRYGITSTQHWSKIICFYSIDEADAFNNFYELLDEYLTRTGNRKKLKKIHKSMRYKLPEK